jgi:hypothetical protein
MFGLFEFLLSLELSIKKIEMCISVYQRIKISLHNAFLAQIFIQTENILFAHGISPFFLNNLAKSSYLKLSHIQECLFRNFTESGHSRRKELNPSPHNKSSEF